MCRQFVTFFLCLVSHFCLLCTDEVIRIQPTEPTRSHLRFFNLDLHISVIADVKDIFESFGHEVVDWSISGHTWVFGKPRQSVEIVNERTWGDLNQEMCDQFYEKYKTFLEGFDGFICTHSPCFSLLYEKFDKPIIIVNSTRYEHPFTRDLNKWKWLNDYLKKGVDAKRVFIVSNNKADREYLKWHTGIESIHIPSLCRYTQAQYSDKRPGFIFKCPFLPEVAKTFQTPQLIQNENLPTPHQWQELYGFKGIVHFPYQISTMSIFEQYTANIPLFFPSKEFLKTLSEQYPESILHQLTFYQVFGLQSPQSLGDLNNLHDPKVLQFWIDNADYYDPENMPHIQYFDSIEHLEMMLQNADCHAISKQMAEHNANRRKMIFDRWQKVLEQVIASTL